MILHRECLPTQLAQTAEQTVIAATFNDCTGTPLTPGTELAKCTDIPAIPAPQTLSIAGNTVTLSGGGGSVTIPDLDTQDLSISGNVISLTNGGSVTLPTTAAPVPQVLSIAGNTVSLSGGGGSVTVPDNDAQTLSIAGNTLSISNGNSVTLPAAAVQDPYATPAQTVAGTATALIVNPADLYARENIPAQTGLGLVLSAIPAPAAEQSPWGVNTLGETLHYAPGLGWKIVDNYFHQNVTANNITLPANVATTIASIVAPRAGLAIITGKGNTQSTSYRVQTSGVAVNGVWLGNDNNGTMSVVGSAAPGTPLHASDAVNTSSAVTMRVAAGDVIAVQGLVVGAAGTGSGIVYLTYLGS